VIYSTISIVLSFSVSAGLNHTTNMLNALQQLVAYIQPMFNWNHLIFYGNSLKKNSLLEIWSNTINDSLFCTFCKVELSWLSFRIRITASDSGRNFFLLLTTLDFASLFPVHVIQK
jgi:hypothetical protein